MDLRGLWDGRWNDPIEACKDIIGSLLERGSGDLLSWALSKNTLLRTLPEVCGCSDTC